MRVKALVFFKISLRSLTIQIQDGLPVAILAVLIVLTAGCGRDDVKVYHVENDGSAVAPQNTLAPALPVTDAGASPQLKWTLPAGWSETAPSQMRVASFLVANATGPAADVGVIPLPASSQETQLVNMWREQMKLAATTSADEKSEAVAIGVAEGKLFDIASSEPIIDGKFRARILVAMLTSGGTSWFFKLTGEDTFVAAQKNTFLQFLKSIRFDTAAPEPIAGATQPANGNRPDWTIPAGWQEAPPSEFLVAKFVIAGPDEAKAQVNISQLAGEGGGLLANVNRWRGQLGLPPITEEDEFSKMVDSFDTGGGKAQVVDMAGTDAKTGQPARLIGTVVPQNGQTWFYKLMGDQKIVAQQKDAFFKFVQSAKYPDAR